METTAIEWIIIVLVAAVKMGTPILFGTLGGVISERAGVINLGMEGLMLIGALTSFVVKLYTGSTLLAIGAAAFAAGAVTSLHALVCISMRASQIASGLALTMFGTGVSGLLGDSLTGKTITPLMDIKIPILSSIPIIGKIFFIQDVLVYFSYIAVAIIWYLLFYTRAGLNIRSIGEAPAVCDSIGLSVMKYRYFAVIIGGMIVGIGGAYFSMVLTPFWVDNLTAGRGWIAVALVIFAFWHPGKAMFGAYLFGAAISLQLRLQLIDIKISPYFLAMFPFILTIAALTIATIRNNKQRIAVMPASLGEAFFRGEKH